MQETNQILNKAYSQVPDEDREYAGRCMKLWRQFASDQISQQELQKELAYLAVGDAKAWAELVYKQLPTRPKELGDFNNLSAFKKAKVGENFWRETGIYTYFESCSRIKAKNKKAIIWLRELKEIFDREGDEIMQRKVGQRINEFLSEGRGIRYNKLY